MAANEQDKRKYHPIMSRRRFMELSGLGTLGLGVMGAGAVFAAQDQTKPEKFKDLDEILSHRVADRKLPYWVREVDKPTVDIDWDNLAPFCISRTLFNPGNWAPGEYEAIIKKQRESVTQKIRDNVPNHSLRDYALVNAAQWGGFYPSIYPCWDGPDIYKERNRIPQHPCFNWAPEDFGVPKWTGTPEEGSRMLRVAGRLLGAADVGFLYLGDPKVRKLLFSNIVFEDAEKGYDADTTSMGMEEGLMVSAKKVLPNKDLWAMTCLMPQSLTQSAVTARGEWGGSNYHAYSRVAFFANKIKTFIKSLGYQAYGGHTAMTGFATGFGVMSGLAEYARTGQMVSPIYGACFRTVLPIITDLPCAVTRPIDAGILKFCRTCKKCARACPAGAITTSTEPFWGGDASYQRKGIKGYYCDIKKCFTNMFSDSPDCGACQSSCTFSKFNEASIHKLITATIGTVRFSSINQVIAAMDDVFGYGMKTDPTYSVWEMKMEDIPLYGLEKSRI